MTLVFLQVLWVYRKYKLKYYEWQINDLRSAYNKKQFAKKPILLEINLWYKVQLLNIWTKSLKSKFKISSSQGIMPI